VSQLDISSLTKGAPSRSQAKVNGRFITNISADASESFPLIHSQLNRRLVLQGRRHEGSRLAMSIIMMSMTRNGWENYSCFSQDSIPRAQVCT